MAAKSSPAKAGNGDALLDGEVIPPGRTAQEHQEALNMGLWDVLKKTDPKHTKPFQRSGGFRGTAIKPIYATEKMTRLFGPCGEGWGTTAPSFTVLGNLVYCTVGLWWRNPDTGDRSEIVYGVGGDQTVREFKGTEKPNDEGFKSAYTDALGNAMKLIGMSADVHMGQFEDSKYVQEVGEEADAEAKRREYEGDRAMMQKIIDDASAATSNEGIDEVLRGASHRIKALRESNPGLVTRMKGEIERLRQSFTPHQEAAE